MTKWLPLVFIVAVAACAEPAEDDAFEDDFETQQPAPTPAPPAAPADSPMMMEDTLMQDSPMTGTGGTPPQ